MTEPKVGETWIWRKITAMGAPTVKILDVSDGEVKYRFNNSGHETKTELQMFLSIHKKHEVGDISAYQSHHERLHGS